MVSVLRIFKIIATSCFLTALECTKFVFGRGSSPDLTGGSLRRSLDPLHAVRGSTSKGGGREERERKRRKKERRDRPPFRKFLDPPLTCLAERRTKEPTSSAEGGDDEGQAEQKADIGRRQASDVAVTDSAVRLSVTTDHQQNKAVSDHTTHADDSIHGRHRRVHRSALIRRCPVDRVVCHDTCCLCDPTNKHAQFIHSHRLKNYSGGSRGGGRRVPVKPPSPHRRVNLARFTHLERNKHVF